jgi:hypothetical protein
MDAFTFLLLMPFLVASAALAGEIVPRIVHRRAILRRHRNSH